ncbi:hypothetical protein [Nostoc sp.]|uniref:hypothetical protein n=1 Tax=Nostoc sp. TaxID=1180 RepID=UPI0035936EFA
MNRFFCNSSQLEIKFSEHINSKGTNAWSKQNIYVLMAWLSLNLTGDAPSSLAPVATTGVHHESTNTTYLFYRSVKTFNSPMRIMSTLLMRVRSRQNKS